MYKTHGVYSITNIQNGKRYIGFTGVNFGDRRDCHFALLRHNRHDNKLLQEEFNLYGESVFSFDVLKTTTETDVNKLMDYERYYISLFDSVNTGYNISYGGYGEGVPINYEHLEKLWKDNKQRLAGKPLSTKTINKMSESHLKNINRRSGCINTSVLTYQDVIDIRKSLLKGESCGHLANKYGVSRSCISLINQNKTWKNVYPDGWVN